MEAVAALSFTCNILQLVSTGLKVTTALKQIRDEHKPDASIKTNASTLRELSSKLEASIQNQNTNGGVGNRDLLERAQDVVKTSHRLEKIFQRYSDSQKGNAVANFFNFAILDKNRIQGAEKRLHEAQQALQSTILVELRDTLDTEWAAISPVLSSLDSSLQPLVRELHDGNMHVANLTRHIDESLSRHLAAIKIDTAGAIKATTEVRETLEQHTRRVTVIHQSQEQKDATRRLLRSLTFPSMNARRNMSALEHAKGTFDWVFERDKRCCNHEHERLSASHSIQRHEAFGALHLWLLDTQQRVFWINGHAGTGKSTLIHYLTDALRCDSLPDALKTDLGNLIALSVFIWASGDEMQRSIKGLLCSLLHQLLKLDSMLANATTWTEASWWEKESLADWSEPELDLALQAALRRQRDIDPSKTVLLFVDGLDEISQEDDSSSRLVCLIDSLQRHSNTKLCVSSRPEPIFERSLQRYPHLRLQDLTYHDIVHYLRQELEEPLRTSQTSKSPWNNVYMVIWEVARRAEGVFLWVQLVTRSLKEGITNGDTWDLLWARIEKTPAKLDSLYKSMLQRRDAQADVYDASAAIFFTLILDGARADMNRLDFITLYVRHDLRIALQNTKGNWAEYQDISVRKAMEDVRVRIRAQCAGLLVVNPGSEDGDHDSMRVGFIHRTAKDFLTDQRRKLWQHVALEWRTCVDVRYLLARDTRTIDDADIWSDRYEWDTTLLWQVLNDIHKTNYFWLDIHDEIMDYLADTMRKNLYWHCDKRNPVVVAVHKGCRTPDHWLATWKPSEISKEDFLNQLLLCAADELKWHSGMDDHGGAFLWLLKHGANPYWQDRQNFDTFGQTAMRVLCDMLKYKGSHLDEEIVTFMYWLAECGFPEDTRVKRWFSRFAEDEE
ncbi:uncharacterized protein B0I36DRAFT_383412 [Microdochium trichocladiopsis]|uniref:NACHT domain-containing protein n=1 Tax=Microdochium trichocladiopsis TaxID=1682393 RepID=A0A9P9BPY0_9PEZI|nr:uncharacterized protein B0I36DRAFT_383412 [Microdochium trichocladiopsis]KAH7033579.1 hypothetical protein B0I36DRAFT_383412 [Microdochium trichocladiopsis]